MITLTSWELYYDEYKPDELKIQGAIASSDDSSIPAGAYIDDVVTNLVQTGKSELICTALDSEFVLPLNSMGYYDYAWKDISEVAGKITKKYEISPKFFKSAFEMSQYYFDLCKRQADRVLSPGNVYLCIRDGVCVLGALKSDEGEVVPLLMSEGHFCNGIVSRLDYSFHMQDMYNSVDPDEIEEEFEDGEVPEGVIIDTDGSCFRLRTAVDDPDMTLDWTFCVGDGKPKMQFRDWINETSTLYIGNACSSDIEICFDSEAFHFEDGSTTAICKKCEVTKLVIEEG